MEQNETEQVEQEAPELTAVEVMDGPDVEGSDEEQGNMEPVAETPATEAKTEPAADPVLEEMKQAAAFGQTTWQKMQKNPTLMLEYLRSEQAEGTLSDAGLARLAELEGEMAAKNPAPARKTSEQINAEVAELHAQGKYAEAAVLVNEWTMGPKLNELENKSKREAQQRIENERKTQTQQAIANTHKELLELQSKYPEFVKVSPVHSGDLRKDVVWKDEAVRAEMARLDNGRIPPLELAELALFRLKRTGRPAAAPATSKPKTTAPKPAQAQAEKPGMFSVSIRRKE